MVSRKAGIAIGVILSVIVIGTVGLSLVEQSVSF